MKRSKGILLVWSIAYAIIAIQVSCKPATTDSAGPAVSAAPSVAVPVAAVALPATRPGAVVVKIENFTFQPRELEVAVGTTVTWQNGDDVPHTATSKDDPQTFDSGALDTDEKFSFTFSKPGKYAYYCKVHPHMTGLVTVK